jgi:hypothetical protein
MNGRDRPTGDDVAAARRQLTRVYARIRDEGEDAVIADLWDGVVDTIAGLPDVREALALVARANGLPYASADSPRTHDDEEAIHQAVVELVQEAQRAGGEMRTSGDRTERRT